MFQAISPVVGFFSWRHRFGPKRHVGLVMENTALGQAFFLVRRFFPVSIIPQTLPTHSHITNSIYTLQRAVIKKQT
jgi:hypothetical protein